MAGQTEWASNLDAAAAYARDQVARIVAARKWDPDVQTVINDAIGRWYTEADGWFSDDVWAFWSGLHDELKAWPSPPAGWDKLLAALATAADTASGTAAHTDASSAWGLARDTAAASAGDVVDAAGNVATTLREGAVQVGTWGKLLRNKWVVGGILLTGLGIGGAALYKRGRG